MPQLLASGIVSSSSSCFLPERVGKKELMGHSPIMMTERYLAPEQDDVQQMRMANVWARTAITTSAAV